MVASFPAPQTSLDGLDAALRERGFRLLRKRKNPREAGSWVELEDGSPGWIRTTECLSQSQVPYRLATGLCSGLYCARENSG